MSILNYFRKKEIVPSDENEGLRELLGPAVLKEVNSEMRKTLTDTPSTSSKTPTLRDKGKSTGKSTGKKYNVYSPKDRADIGKFCLENGPARTVQKFSVTFPNLNESTARFMREKFKSETSTKKRKLDFSEVTEIQSKKRGRPLVLGEELDSKVQSYVKVMRSNGCVINSSIKKSIGKGIVLATDKSLLLENGGQINITKSWARSLLNRMNFVKRKGSTACKADKVENFDDIKSGFLNRIRDTVNKYDIPADMVINWDHSGLNLIPVSDWTMETEGSKRVEISGLGDKRQYTAVFAGTLKGEFLPPQIIFAGKTTRSLPSYRFPKDWHITFTENHWANGVSQIDYVDRIIVPYLQRKRKELALPSDAKALCIFDVFRAQMTDEFIDYLTNKNIKIVYVPANCTDRLQPMDLSVQKAVKTNLKHSFEEWYSRQIMKQIEQKGSDNIEPIPLPIACMKEHVSKWLVKMYQDIKNNPDLIMNGFRQAGILETLEDFLPLNMTATARK